MDVAAPCVLGKLCAQLADEPAPANPLGLNRLEECLGTDRGVSMSRSFGACGIAATPRRMLKPWPGEARARRRTACPSEAGFRSAASSPRSEERRVGQEC